MSKDADARRLLSDLVTVLGRAERCRYCIDPLDGGFEESCHKDAYATALRRARAFLKRGAAN